MIGGASLSATALAQPTQAQIETAKKTAAEAANKALDAFERGKYEEAIAGFQKADKAFHASKFVLYIARAQARMGKLTAAKATYESLVKEQLAAYAPPEFFAAQSDAKKELADLAPRIPTLTIQAKSGVKNIVVDGQPVTAGQALSLDPGDHSVSAQGPSTRAIAMKISLKERETKTITLEPADGSTADAPSGSSTPDSASPSGSGAPGDARSSGDSPSSSGSSGSFLGSMPTVTKVTYGIGAAGLVAGAVFGGLTLAKKGDYDASRSAGDADAANDAGAQGRTFAVVTDIGFLVAIAGVATGTIVWVVAPAKPSATTGHLDPNRPSRAGGSGGAALAPRLQISPTAGGLSVSGAF